MGWALAIHGGAGLVRRDVLTGEREQRCLRTLSAALEVGRAVLEAGGSALDAVQATVVHLEDDPVFNAGRGSVLTAAGRVEMDAAIADGNGRRAGAVAGVTTVRNAILLAREVMDHTPHVMLIAGGAEHFARERGLQTVDPAWFLVEERLEQLDRAKAADRFELDHGSEDKDVYGTVGAVACDANGHVATATSTGGMINKRPGRVGDSPILGAGTFADDATCAVGGTGHGEPFIRLGVGARVSALVELAGLSLADAAHRVIFEELPRLDGQGGLIAVDRHGNLALPYNTAGMFRGWVREGEAPSVAIW
ncbi:MAG: isoaspartyl peptidase/L-asparaginase [Alphaproteobacteria bacterium]|nr:isoaspartyl peptidase/L-asparaginase [Alphaproteobacteria bacterium]MCB9699585.1 isoaspartyl peptidase/L-asparaginase [Alphaproteobacteria bacterium]